MTFSASQLGIEVSLIASNHPDFSRFIQDPVLSLPRHSRHEARAKGSVWTMILLMPEATTSTPVPGTTAHPAVPPNQKIFPFAILLIINFKTTPLTL
jgi:hypothetical protein